MYKSKLKITTTDIVISQHVNTNGYKKTQINTNKHQEKVIINHTYTIDLKSWSLTCPKMYECERV